MSSSPGDVPDHLLRNGRPVDPEFDAVEQLYRRCLMNQLDPQGRLLPAAVGFRNWSVNRGKYSQPGDVLLPHWKDWGAVSFLVQHIPAQLTTGGGVTYEFKVEHAPLDDNFAHAEIRTFKDGLYVTNPDPPSTVKKQFRQLLSERTKVAIQPSV